MTVLRASFRPIPQPSAAEAFTLDQVEARAQIGLGRVLGRPVAESRSEDGRVRRVSALSRDYTLSLVMSFSESRLGVAMPRTLVVDVLADAEWLRDPTMANLGIFGREHTNPEFVYVEEALAWIRKYCLRSPIPRLTEAELVEAERRKLSNGTDIKSALAWAKLMGPLFGGHVTAALVAREIGLTMEDAQVVVALVRKILPKKRVILDR